MGAWQGDEEDCVRAVQGSHASLTLLKQPGCPWVILEHSGEASQPDHSLWACSGGMNEKRGGGLMLML